MESAEEIVKVVQAFAQERIVQAGKAVPQECLLSGSNSLHRSRKCFFKSPHKSVYWIALVSTLFE